MNPQEARERADGKQDLSVLSAHDRQALAEQAAADQAEEERVARGDKVWAEGLRTFLHPRYMPLPPWLFADERSQRKAEAMAREERPWDDYSPWQNE